jgi:hypothetical protein
MFLLTLWSLLYPEISLNPPEGIFAGIFGMALE